MYYLQQGVNNLLLTRCFETISTNPLAELELIGSGMQQI